MRILTLFLMLLTALPAWAGEVSFSGPMKQGGLVIGQTEPGTRVQVDGTFVRVTEGGHFLVGFGRDATEVSVVIHSPHGKQSHNLKPEKQDYEIQRIDGLPQKKVTPDPESLKRIQADAAKVKAVRKIDRPKADFLSGFVWPVKGPISGVFGSQRILNGEPRNPHNGTDIAAPRGTTIHAPAAGVVALTDADMFLMGKTVMIDHGHGLTSVYIHMDEILVEFGQPVEQGTPIGTIGATGRATGPHLHWGVNLFSTALDPELLVGPMPQ